MNKYQVKYLRSKWVVVNVGFAEDVNFDDREHEELALTAAANEELQNFEYFWDGGPVHEETIEMDLGGDGNPDVVIRANGSVVPYKKYVNENTQTTA